MLNWALYGVVHNAYPSDINVKPTHTFVTGLSESHLRSCSHSHHPHDPPPPSVTARIPAIKNTGALLASSLS